MKVNWAVVKKIIGIKDKPKYNPGVIGVYDCRPFDNFKYALIYANEVCISETDDESIAKVIVYTREYRNTTFINVLVYNEEGFNISDYTYEKMKPVLLEHNITPAEKSVVMVLFQHNNENTVALAKSFCNSNKYHFEQAAVYNPKEVYMEFYKPVPVFYKQYHVMCEDLYFDLAFIDGEND